jgi:hypothetical protein
MLCAGFVAAALALSGCPQGGEPVQTWIEASWVRTVDQMRIDVDLVPYSRFPTTVVRNDFGGDILGYAVRWEKIENKVVRSKFLAHAFRPARWLSCISRRIGSVSARMPRFSFTWYGEAITFPCRMSLNG